LAPDQDFPFDRIRELYLYEEPALLASIRRGDRKEATRIINLLLVHIYSAGAQRSELLKGLLLELIVMMSRAAVEAGAAQSEVLGLRFQHLTELALIEDEEQLSSWLRGSVVRIFEVVERHQTAALPSTVARALKIIREESGGELTRTAVARKAGVSPSHLTELLQERTGRTFTELVRETRIERACELLRSTELSMAEIAADCGFCDQSYFTHVFQKLKNETPKQYREGFSRTPKTQNIPP
jgi:AraC-like DNA-binding protein